MCARTTQDIEIYIQIYRKLSFAQHPCGSDSESHQYGCFLKRNVFRMDLKEGRLGASCRGLGMDSRSCVWESTLSIFVEFDVWNSHETSICRTQRAGRLIDREKIREVSRSRWISATIAQGGNLVLNLSSDWQPMQRSEQRLCMVLPLSAKDKMSCIVLYSLQAIQPIFWETCQQRIAVVQPCQNERWNQLLCCINS